MSKKLKIKNKRSKMKSRKPHGGKKAVVLLSGGLDSATALYAAMHQGYAPFCLTFDYGQKHKKEILLARKIAKKAGCSWQKMTFRLPWKGSSLIDGDKKIPRRRDLDTPEIPSTYVPGRNIIFLSFAAACAESIGAQAIFIGANQIDYSGYPDCREGFLKLYEQTLSRGTKKGVLGQKIRIVAPLVKKNKAEIVSMALRLNVPLALTWSCYQGGVNPCGVCDSCRLRAKGFAAAGITDPAS